MSSSTPDEQLELGAPARPLWADWGTPAEWWDFHLEHPEIGEALAALALPLAASGHERLSISMLWETLRYRSMIGALPGESSWRLNNVWRAYYARWLMAEHRELRGRFEVRLSEAERAIGSNHAALREERSPHPAEDDADEGAPVGQGEPSPGD